MTARVRTMALTIAAALLLSAGSARADHTITATAGLNGTIAPSGAVVVADGASQTFTMVPDPCYRVGDVVVDGVSQGPVASYTFEAVSAGHTIVASFVRTSFTITALWADGGMIAPEDPVTVPCGGSVTYTLAATDKCYTLTDARVDGASVGAVSTYTFTNVQSDHTIEPVFSRHAPFTIQTVAGPGGEIEPSGTVLSACGQTRTFKIVPCPNAILDVKVDGVSVGPVKKYSFIDLQENHTIEATFGTTPSPFRIQIVGGDGGAKISPSGGSYLCGGSPTFTFSGIGCNTLADVWVDGVSLGPIASYTFTNLREDHTLSAFSLPVPAFSITATAGAGGTISPAGVQTIPCGTSPTFVFTPNFCHAVSDVKVDGVSRGPLPSYTFINVRLYHTVQVTFAPIGPFTITATAQAGITMSPLGTTTIACGSTLPFTISASACATALDVKVDGVSRGPLTSYTFSYVQANHTIDATFRSFTITATAAGGGAITPAGVVAAPCGSSRTFMIAPASDCYAVTDVVVDGVSQGPITAYTFGDVQGDHTIQVQATPTAYFTITPTAGPDGAVSPSGPQSVPCGGSRTFTFLPGDCRTVTDVKVDGVSRGLGTSFTFTDVRADHRIEVAFGVTPYSIVTTTQPGITVTGPVGPVSCGAAATYTVATSQCPDRLDVKIDGVSQGPLASYTFANVRANHRLDATLTPFRITATAGPGGAITPNGEQIATCGSSHVYYIQPVAGFNIAEVYADGTPVGPVASYTFTHVTADHSLHATFADLSPPGVRLIYPNGGEILLIGDPGKISWTASDASGIVAVDLSFSRNGSGGAWLPIATGLPNSGTYVWPAIPGPGGNAGADPEFSAFFRVEARDGTGSSGSDVSDGGIALYDLATSTLLSMFDAAPLHEGVELRWQIGHPELFASTRVERGASQAGPWTSLEAEAVTTAGVTRVTDATAVPGVTYHYRLVGFTGSGHEATLGSLSVQAGVPVTEFELFSVGPTPSRGPVSIRYAVAREANVGVSVVDLQGRTVARLADGMFRPGRYSATWNGTLERGGEAPAGVYFVRYRFPGRAVFRRVVIAH